MNPKPNATPTDRPSIITWEEAVEHLCSQPERQDLVRSCYYDSPLLDVAKRFSRSEEWKAILALLDCAPGRVLDVGAGRGIASFAFAEAKWDVVALEPDPSQKVGAGAIKQLSLDSGHPIAVCEQWGESLPFENETFDLVYGRAVFHHARHLGEFCSEAARVLKRGGIFLMTREHVISRRDDLQAFLDSHPLHKLYGGEAAYLLREYTDAMTSAGLRVDRIIGPASSVINYFPQTISEHAIAIAARLGGPLGPPGRLAWKAILKVPGIQTTIEMLMNLRNKVPGRLYTFLAIKP
jgi:SAM-dependent methyltransferase